MKREMCIVPELAELEQTQEMLRHTNEILEQKVAERTEELALIVARLKAEIAERQMTEDALMQSETLLTTILNTLPVAVWMLDADCRIKAVNPAGKKIWCGDRFDHVEQSEAYKRWWRDTVKSTSVEEFGGSRAALRGESFLNEICEIECFDGSRKTVRNSAVPLRSEQGEIFGAVVVSEDITKRVRAEEQILRLNRLYAMLSGTNQAIAHAADRDSLFREICRVAVERGEFRMAWVGVAVETDGVVKPAAWSGINEGYLDTLRVPVGKDQEDTDPAGTAIREGGLSIWNDFMNDPRVFPRREEVERRGFRSAASIALKMDGKIIGALTIYAGEEEFFRWQMAELLRQMAADISFALENLDREARRRRTEQALLEETAERLRVMEALVEKDQLLIQQSRLAAMGEMINYIAHQFRQPLNTIGLLVQVLKNNRIGDEPGDEPTDRTAEQIMDVIMHMSRTIDDFRDFFKTGREMEKFNLKEITWKTLSFISDALSVQNVEVTLEGEDDLVMAGYPNEYSQVLLNILGNARDAFIEREIRLPRIDIRLFSEGDRAVVTVTDNAGGIPPGIIERVFDSYFTTKEEGTGIGLHMAKTIIEKRMKGRIRVRNTGEGAEFRVEI